LGQFGDTADALKYLTAARDISPRKQQILFQLGITYLQSGNPSGALASFKAAFDLDPTYDTARILYAGGFYYTGDVASGDKVLTEKYGSPIVDNDQLLRVYMDTKHYDRAVTIWQKRLEKDPKNVDLHLGLATVYFTSGDKAATIAELQKISALDPSKAAQMQQLITQIQNGTLKP
jgi:tetratricopeptide (TPR) repeat protein